MYGINPHLPSQLPSPPEIRAASAAGDPPVCEEKTPLELAIELGSLDQVRQLIAGGADMNILTSRGETLLNMAAISRQDAIVEYMLSNGAFVDLKNRKGKGLLRAATRRHDTYVMQAALKAGATVDLPDNMGVTPLLNAVRKLNRPCTSLLLSANANIHARDHEGKTPFSLALESEDVRLILLMVLEAGLDYQQFKENYLDLYLAEFFKKPRKSDSEKKCFFERIVKTDLGGCWFSGEVASPCFESQLEQNPFLLMHADSENFMFYTADRELMIAKDVFYSVWREKRNDKTAIRDVILKSYGRNVQSAGRYELILVSSELSQNPLVILSNLTFLFRKNLYALLHVDFVGQSGVDAGGLGRQFMSGLFTALTQVMPFKACEGELVRPWIPEQLDGTIPSLKETDRVVYREIGQLIMFCLNAYHPFPIGQLFTPGFFVAICKMQTRFLRREFESIDFNDPDIFLTYRQLLGMMASESDREMLESFDRYLALTEEASDGMIQEAYAAVCTEKSLEVLAIGENIAMMRLHFTQIKEAIRQRIIHSQIRSTFAPLHEIARGMRESSFNFAVGAWEIALWEPCELANRLQGVVSGEEIVEKLIFYETPGIIQRGLKAWILKAEKRQLELFLFAVTGSPALAKSAKIEVRPGEQVSFRTCFKCLYINYENTTSESDLQAKVEFALNLVAGDSKFDDN